jgi:hypothetical protein
MTGLLSEDTKYHLRESWENLRWDLFGKYYWRARHRVNRLRYRECRPAPKRGPLLPYNLAPMGPIFPVLKPLSQIIKPKRARGETFKCHIKGIGD